MATKPSARIPTWATTHTAQPTGSDPLIYPVIEPSPAMIAAGWTPPPSSPPYEVSNALHSGAGKWIAFFDQLFNTNGAYTGGAANGRLEASVDTIGEIRFKAVHNAAAVAALEGTRVKASQRLDVGASALFTAADSGAGGSALTTLLGDGQLNRLIYRGTGFYPGAAEDGITPRPALYAQNLVIAALEIQLGGSAGAYTLAMATDGLNTFTFNASALAWNAGTGEVTFTHANGATGLRAPLGPTLGLMLGGESYSSAFVYKIAKNAAAGGASSSYGFYILYQAIAGGAWTVLKPGDAGAHTAGLRFGLAML